MMFQVEILRVSVDPLCLCGEIWRESLHHRDTEIH